MKWGLALAGGGTKGSYHIGVWKAIRELGIELEAVTGTSIGAVNGAFIVSDDYSAAIKLWNSVEMNDIVNIAEETKENKNLFHLKNVPALATEIHKNKGIDVTPFEKLINTYINEKKVRDSKINYGLVTYNISDRTEAQLFKENIPDGKLAEYIVASSSFPGFKPKKIGGSLFIDGGVWNNMPVDMLIERDCINIIAVDVGGFGIVRSTNISGRNIVKIRPVMNVVGIMDFDSKAIEANMQQGYYDAMKSFGIYTGDFFYFNTSDYYAARRKYSSDILSGIETAGRMFNIERFKCYRVDELIRDTLIIYRNQNKVFDSELFKFTDERYIMCCISEAIVNGNTDLLNNKLVSGLAVGVFEGARAIAYFIKNGLYK